MLPRLILPSLPASILARPVTGLSDRKRPEPERQYRNNGLCSSRQHGERIVQRRQWALQLKITRHNLGG